MGIYVTPIPQDISFKRLYTDERLQVLARYPDFDPNAKIFNGTSADAIAPERVQQWNRIQQGVMYTGFIPENGVDFIII